MIEGRPQISIPSIFPCEKSVLLDGSGADTVAVVEVQEEERPLDTKNNAGLSLDRRQFLSRSLIAGAGALTGASILSACGDDDTASSKPSAPGTVRVQLNWVEEIQFAGLYAADKAGALAKNKVRHKLLAGGPEADPIQILASKSADVAFAPGTNDVILARSNGIPLKAFAAQFQRTPAVIMSRRDDPILSAQDLAGKRMGLQPAARAAMQAILQINKIPTDEVKLITVADDPTPLLTKQIDGFMAFAFAQPIALRLRGIETAQLSLTDLGYGDYVAVYSALDETIERRADDLVRWLRSVQAGWKHFLGNKQDMVRYTVDRSPELKLDAKQQTLEAEEVAKYLSSDLTQEKGLLWMNTDGFERGVDLLTKTGQLKKPVAIEEMVTLRILERAFPASA